MLVYFSLLLKLRFEMAAFHIILIFVSCLALSRNGVFSIHSNLVRSSLFLHLGSVLMLFSSVRSKAEISQFVIVFSKCNKFGYMLGKFIISTLLNRT